MLLLHSHPAVELLPEVEAVWRQCVNVQDVSPTSSADSRNIVHQGGQILHSKVVSVVSPLIAQSLQYLTEQKYVNYSQLILYNIFNWLKAIGISTWLKS